MSFLSIMQDVAKNAGIRVPTTVGLKESDQIKLGEFINEAGLEIVRRVDWGSLRTIVTLTVTGAAGEYTIADDYSRLSGGSGVISNGVTIRGSLTPDEWLSLTPAAGTTRYYYLRGTKIAFYPYPPTGTVLKVQYQSKNWVDDKASARLVLDADEALIPERLLTLGGIWRWRRHVGKDYADHMAEFESALIDEARFDSGTRTP